MWQHRNCIRGVSSLSEEVQIATGDDGDDVSPPLATVTCVWLQLSGGILELVILFSVPEIRVTSTTRRLKEHNNYWYTLYIYI